MTLGDLITQATSLFNYYGDIQVTLPNGLPVYQLGIKTADQYTGNYTTSATPIYNTAVINGELPRELSGNLSTISPNNVYGGYVVYDDRT